MSASRFALLAVILLIASATFALADAPPKVFNVKDYHAAGDGVTDDRAAIQNAIDAAAAAGGGIVKFPAGTYLLNSNRPSTHPWFFYNLKIGSNITLSGTAGVKLLQGPGGRHALVAGAPQVRNTVLAFGPDYTTIRFQNASYNGGFHELKPTTANQTTVSLERSADAGFFKTGDYVAIYKQLDGDVIPTETSMITKIDPASGAIELKYPLARSFPSPHIANVTALATTNIGVENLIVQGVEPLAVTEAFGFKAERPPIFS